jgi:hypothetical protein
MHAENRYCVTCGRPTRHESPGANHILHLLLTIVTAAISGGIPWWIAIWIVATFARAWSCSTCGADPLRHRRLIAPILALVAVTALAAWFAQAIP